MDTNMKENERPEPMGFITEMPKPSAASPKVWGSDAIAAMVGSLDIPYLALNPGASFRGLHDSLVNYLGNSNPQMLLCLHEENAVAIAHGYAKASDRMMGVVLHSNVGLMHGLMGIFNAWCDRHPMLVLGATGPWDARKRRPWIDWIHTCSDQGALLRDFTKWDNQPGSIEAAYEALLRGAQLARTTPKGPVYINLDVTLQETELPRCPPLPDVARYGSPPLPVADPVLIAQAAGILSEAKRPVIVAGRVSRSLEAWQRRVRLAEMLQARVWTDLKSAAAFPTDHVLHAGPPGTFLAARPPQELAEADVILSLDWNDLSGLLQQVYGDHPVSAKVIQISADAHNHRGWSADHQGLPPTDAYLLCDPDAAIPLLIDALSHKAPRPPAHRTDGPRPSVEVQSTAPTHLSTLDVARVFNDASEEMGIEVTLTRLPLAWKGDYRHFRHPLDFLGYDGGGGVGSGPGITVGAALALKDSDRVVAGIMGDGDFLMGVTTLWTATHYRIPCLFVICNNRSFFNDEMHQEKMALLRGRPVENRWIGQRIEYPDIDLAAMARAQGASAAGPITTHEQLVKAIREGLARVREGEVHVIDVRVT